QSTGPDLVADEVDVAPIRRVAVRRIPLPVDNGERHTGVAAIPSDAVCEAHAVVFRASRAEVDERQVVEVEVAARVDGELGVAATAARRRIPYLGCRSHKQLERLAAVLRLPDAARLRGTRARDSRVH